MSLFVNVAGAPYLPAQVVTTGIVMLWTFLAHQDVDVCVNRAGGRTGRGRAAAARLGSCRLENRSILARRDRRRARPCARIFVVAGHTVRLAGFVDRLLAHLMIRRHADAAACHQKGRCGPKGANLRLRRRRGRKPQTAAAPMTVPTAIIANMVIELSNASQKTARILPA